MKITPNLIVPSIEACLPFWVDRLGFTKTVEVPDGDALGFVILVKDGTELMLQSERSLAADVSSVPSSGYRAALYVTVPSLEAVQHALEGYRKVVDERTTFYGARETVVLDPAGNVIAFGEHTSG
jgi:catechol 2,3-dioxygenase-like lactoylglutathione lyase family enzyme